MGSPRTDPVTNEPKNPTSNLDAGFGHTLNDHVWYMDDETRYLYAGTYNAATGSRNDPVNGPLLLHNMGAHLYRSPDDWYYSAVTTNGFSNLSDPYGGKFDFGVRTMTSTPAGVFVGTANDYYGLTVLRAREGTAPVVDLPGKLEVEASRSGGALLSWVAAIGGAGYQIWRAERLPILVRDDVNFENYNGVTGNKIPDIYVGEYQLVGTTTDVVFLDATVQSGHKYMYYVVTTGIDGTMSQPSSLVSFPVLLPPMTFAQSLAAVSKLARRQRFNASDPQGLQVSRQLMNAQTAAAACKLSTAANILDANAAAGETMYPDSVDIGILIGKLQRRIRLYNRFPAQVSTTEFCTGPTP